jgi:hypothetical protein
MTRDPPAAKTFEVSELAFLYAFGNTPDAPASPLLEPGVITPTPGTT